MTEAEKQPILFDTYPDLSEKIPWISLGKFPTTVHRLEGFGHPQLWIKRDDLSSSIYGGNKIRKLEFLLGDVKKRKKTRVVTLGGIGTNHGLATAIFCARLNLRCSLILFEQPVNKYVRQNLILFHRYGAEMIFKKTTLKAGLYFYIFKRLRNPRAYYLYAGGSTPVGALGFVNAVFELKRQIHAGLIPEPDYIFCPLGSNGTMAGLALGLLLSGMEAKVIGVRVAPSHLGPFEMVTPGAVLSLMKKTYRDLRAKSSRIPRVHFPLPTVLDDYFGQGYGYSTEAGEQALYLMKKKGGIKLEPTYTSKTFAAVLDFIKNRTKKEEKILYWHTYNSVDLGQEADDVDYRNLPNKFHRYFRKPLFPFSMSFNRLLSI